MEINVFQCRGTQCLSVWGWGKVGGGRFKGMT